MNSDEKEGKAALPQFKKFVSEAEVEERKRKRQEEWEKVRQPHQPVEAPPEEPVDNRCLFDRLQEQKNLKQEEFDKEHMLKNQVRGLDDDEANFLETVSRRQEEIVREREEEEEKVIAEYRNSRANQVVSDKIAAPARPATSVDQKPKNTQLQLLSGAVRRKRTSGASDETANAKEAKLEENANEQKVDKSVTASSDIKDPSVDTSQNSSSEDETPSNGVAKVVAILPGIGGVYTDSDETDSSSDSEIDTDFFKRPKTVQEIHPH